MPVRNGHVRVGAILGVPIFLHWSLPIGLFVFSGFEFVPEIFFGIFASIEPDVVPMIGIGLIFFLIGLAILVNGWLFTLPKKRNAIEEAAERDRLRDMLGTPSELSEGRYLAPPPASVVEHTTRELPREPAAAPRARTTGE